MTTQYKKNNILQHYLCYFNEKFTKQIKCMGPLAQNQNLPEVGVMAQAHNFSQLRNFSRVGFQAPSPTQVGSKWARKERPARPQPKNCPKT